MSWHHGASDGERTLPSGIAADWTPRQSLAAVRSLDELRGLIYAHHLRQIRDQMRTDRQSATGAPYNDHPQILQEKHRIKNTRGLSAPSSL